MQDTVISNADVAHKSEWMYDYVMVLISPRMTVPCQMAMSAPMKTSPTIVEFGATKMNP